MAAMENSAAVGSDERTVFFPTRTRPQHRTKVDRCFLWTNVFSGATFFFLGLVIIIMSAYVSNSWYKSAYLAGGVCEVLLGSGLLTRLLLMCLKFPGLSTPLQKTGDATSCLLFLALTLLFLVWVTSVCALFAAVVQNALNIGVPEEDIVLITISCVSIILELLFGGSVCLFVGCSID